jgi:Flp pilus assembly protein TadD
MRTTRPAGLFDELVVGVLGRYASMAEQSGNWAEAAKRWETVASQFPHAVDGYVGQARALRERGLPDDARAILEQAVGQFPSATGPLHDLGRLAEAQGAWTLAEQCWRKFVALDPHPCWAHTALAYALREQGRIAEAESVLEAQFEPHANQPATFIDYAGLAERSGDLSEAARRWETVALRFPHIADGYVGRARVLRERGLPDDARIVLEQTVEQFPSATGPLHDLGRLAQSQHNWTLAEQCWRKFVALDPHPWWAHTALIEAICRLRRPTDAAAVFAEARDRFPNQIEVWIEFATTLCDTGELDTAKTVVSEAVQKAPSQLFSNTLRLGRAAIRCGDLASATECLRRLRLEPNQNTDASAEIPKLEHDLKIVLAEFDPQKLAELERGPGPDRSASGDASLPLPLADGDKTKQKRLLLRFESLGGDAPGCEIGLVQRKLGIEPLSLLRWTTTPGLDLIAAMEARLEGIGDPENTELFAPHHEYKTMDRRYSMNMAAFVAVASVPYDVMLQRSLKRITFLRKKLVQDLTEGHKIFVYRTREDSLDLSQVLRLKAAMRQFGPNNLLYIKLADSDNPVGSVRPVVADLCFGYVEKFSAEPNAVLYMGGWESVFRQAASIWPDLETYTSPHND